MKQTLPQLYTDSFYSEVFRFNFYVVRCDNKERVHQLLIHLDDNHVIEKPKETSRASMYPITINGQTVPVICLYFEQWEKSPDQIASVVHEAIHSICFFFRIREITLPKDLPPDHRDEENFCYWLDWLVEKVITFLDEGDKHKTYLPHERPTKSRAGNHRRVRKDQESITRKK